jgi:hypothetical protein
MTNFNAWPGLNDNIHGDERREHLGAERVDLYDVLGAIETGTSTHDGHSHHDWINRICECDEITTIMRHIVKNRHNPAYAEIMSQIEIAIEGWL